MFLYVVVVVGLQFPLVDVGPQFLRDQNVHVQGAEANQIQGLWVVLYCVEDRGFSCPRSRNSQSAQRTLVYRSRRYWVHMTYR